MNWLADFNQICMDITLGHDEELIDFGDLDLFFKVSAGLKLAKFEPKGACMHNISRTSWRILTRFAWI